MCLRHSFLIAFSPHSTKDRRENGMNVYDLMSLYGDSIILLDYKIWR